jgi:hypothetical protein
LLVGKIEKFLLVTGGVMERNPVGLYSGEAGLGEWKQRVGEWRNAYRVFVWVEGDNS